MSHGGIVKYLSAALRGSLAAALAAIVYVPASTWQAPVGSFVGAAPQHAVWPLNSPTWHSAYAHDFPGCVKRLPAGTIPSSLLVVRLDGTMQRMAFDVAWARGHNRNHADDVWTVGACR